MSVALSAAGVTHRYGDVVALDDVSLELRAESATAIVGQSGSGKTTLLRCFNRMIEPTVGAIKVGSDDVRSTDATLLRRSIGYVQQHGGLIPHWTVAENVALVLKAMNRADRRAVNESLSRVGLDPEKFAKRFPHQLSGGQRQRVALARALAAKPVALLLDEPFGALDAVSRAEVQRAFSDVQRELRLTMLLVTHDLAEAARMADDIVVMHNGRVDQRGTICELRDKAATEYVGVLISSALEQVEPLVRGTSQS
ncbi:MAG TPA: ATP-binding cassette domain-containing protein [Gemmatimonadaceae bacterium]|nr:ATP-binding cassette domain-containing protein [Gemmatimonadaceae bacterium]